MGYVVALAVMALCVSLTACGSDGAPKSVAVATVGQASGTPRASVTAPVPAARTQPAERARSRGALPKGSAVVVARRVCRGLSAEQVRRRFLAGARARSSARDRVFLKSVGKPSRALLTSSSYPYAAARVYAMSRPVSDRAAAYAGCSFELSMKKESGR
jgi:hypothetical protein